MDDELAEAKLPARGPMTVKMMEMLEKTRRTADEGSTSAMSRMGACQT